MNPPIGGIAELTDRYIQLTWVVHPFYVDYHGGQMPFWPSIACSTGFILLWCTTVYILGVLVFRLVGIHLSWNPFLRCREQHQLTVRQLSTVQYVLWMGVFMWGWGVFLSLSFSDFLDYRYYGESAHDLSPHRLVVGFVFYTLAGVCFGYLNRKL